VSCPFPSETLALHAGGDLPDAIRDSTVRHLAACEECRGTLEELRASQALLKTLREDAVLPAECTAMRRRVMAIIAERREGSGWALRLERAIVLGLRRPAYAMAASVLLGVLSVSVLAQMRHGADVTRRSQALFEGTDTFLRPEGYRNWVPVSRSTGRVRSPGERAPAPAGRVYIDPGSYREYAKTGEFPDGTVMLWEPEGGHLETATSPHSSARLLASVKDGARFDGGWGFYDFTEPGGTLALRAQPLPESSGCRRCHQRQPFLAYRG